MWATSLHRRLQAFQPAILTTSGCAPAMRQAGAVGPPQGVSWLINNSCSTVKKSIRGDTKVASSLLYTLAQGLILPALGGAVQIYTLQDKELVRNFIFTQHGDNV